MVGLERLHRSGGGGGRIADENGRVGSTVELTSRPRDSFNFVVRNCQPLQYDNYIGLVSSKSTACRFFLVAFLCARPRGGAG